MVLSELSCANGPYCRILDGQPGALRPGLTPFVSGCAAATARGGKQSGYGHRVGGIWVGTAEEFQEVE
jgi:hypothetical protein